VQLLLLTLGLLIDACVFVMVVLSVSQPPALWVLGMAAAPALAIAWLGAYRKRSMGPIADGVTIGSLCVITMAVDGRWDGWQVVLLAAAVIFTAGFGSLEHVLLRTAALTAIELGEGLVDPASFTVAVVFAVGIVFVACLMSGMVNSIARYESTAGRERILAATGLELVAAVDLPQIAAASVESLMALCGGLKGVRASLAMVTDPDVEPASFAVVAAAGTDANELAGTVIPPDQVDPAGNGLAEDTIRQNGINFRIKAGYRF
jgi:hypothetical protein